MGKQYLRAHHINSRRDLNDGLWKSNQGYEVLYGVRFEEEADGLLMTLLHEQDTEIEIVDGLDSVCKAGPRCQYADSCDHGHNKGLVYSFDEKNRIKFNLQVGDVYTVRELLALKSSSDN